MRLHIYDGQSMVREMQKNSSGVLVPTATYLTGPRGPEYRRDDTQTETDGQGHTFGKTRWYVYDGLGSVVGEVDPLGNLTCSDEYDVYGGVRGRNGTASTAHGFVGSLGHLSDASTGLIYMRARYYDPGTGRFASEDYKKDTGNWFTYCSDNPINNIDVDGKTLSPIGQAANNALFWLAVGIAVAGSLIALCSFPVCAAALAVVAEAAGTIILDYVGTVAADTVIMAATDAVVAFVTANAGAIAVGILATLIGVMGVESARISVLINAGDYNE